MGGGWCVCGRWVRMRCVCGHTNMHTTLPHTCLNLVSMQQLSPSFPTRTTHTTLRMAWNLPPPTTTHTTPSRTTTTHEARRRTNEAAQCCMALNGVEEVGGWGRETTNQRKVEWGGREYVEGEAIYCLPASAAARDAALRARAAAALALRASACSRMAFSRAASALRTWMVSIKLRLVLKRLPLH